MASSSTALIASSSTALMANRELAIESSLKSAILKSEGPGSIRLKEANKWIEEHNVCFEFLQSDVYYACHIDITDAEFSKIVDAVVDSSKIENSHKEKIKLLSTGSNKHGIYGKLLKVRAGSPEGHVVDAKFIVQKQGSKIDMAYVLYEGSYKFAKSTPAQVEAQSWAVVEVNGEYQGIPATEIHHLQVFFENKAFEAFERKYGK